MIVNNTEKKEELLIRSGDLLNYLGILRSAKIYNYSLSKNRFVELIKKNYNIKNKVPLDFFKKIDFVWNSAINFFDDMGINNGSNSDIIRIKDIYSRFQT